MYYVQCVSALARLKVLYEALDPSNELQHLPSIGAHPPHSTRAYRDLFRHYAWSLNCWMSGGSSTQMHLGHRLSTGCMLYARACGC